MDRERRVWGASLRSSEEGSADGPLQRGRRTTAPGLKRVESGRRLSQYIVICACIILVVSVPSLFANAGQDVQPPSGRADSREGESDESKIGSVRKRCDVLRREYQETESLYRKQMKDLHSLGKEIAESAAGDRTNLEHEYNLLSEDAANTLLIRLAQDWQLLHVEKRLKNLERLVPLRNEIERLEAQRKDKVAAVKAREARWASDRAALLNAEAFVRLRQKRLNDMRRLIKGDDRGGAGGVHEQVENLAKMRSAAHANFLKNAIESAEWTIHRAEAARAKSKQGWDGIAQAWDELLDIDVSLMMSRGEMTILENTRGTWDTEEAPANPARVEGDENIIRHG
jgi:uncharacterized small protein (DUF1192 family)